MTIRLFFSSSRLIWDSTDWVAGIEKAGYTGWEIVADGRYRFDDGGTFRDIRETLESTHLHATVHAPYSDLNPASLNYPIWRESVRQICTCITRSAEITDRVTIHPGYLSPVGKLVPEKVWELQKNALKEIGAVARNAGVVASLENMGGAREFLCRLPEEIIGMTEGIEGIELTFDLGHAHTLGKVKEFLHFLPQANHLHIHDNHGEYDEHLALGDGTIDWETAGKAVRDQYSGIVVVEGRNLDEARKSYDLFRRCFV
ncbi:MAG: sugar phosphate isomerase/epimerase [Methanomicrobiales archaeon]|nr:sugar phosphate isomerase/epimerase [Methanomicrobiales archaeon]